MIERNERDTRRQLESVGHGGIKLILIEDARQIVIKGVTEPDREIPEGVNIVERAVELFVVRVADAQTPSTIQR